MLQLNILKVIKMPIIWGMLAGIMFNILNLDVSFLVKQYGTVFKNTFSLLGLMIIGIAFIADDNKAKTFDFKFILHSLIGRFIIFPTVTIVFIVTDLAFLHIFSSSLYMVLTLFSVLPIGSLIVAFASELKIHPQKSSSVVLITTIVSLFVIPLVFGVISSLV